jgi:hypothetical protein
MTWKVREIPEEMQHVIKKNVNILDTKFAGTLILDFQTPEL